MAFSYTLQVFLSVKNQMLRFEVVEVDIGPHAALFKQVTQTGAHPVQIVWKPPSGTKARVFTPLSVYYLREPSLIAAVKNTI